ncbi:MAG: hypothetical protein NC228_08240, partial [[Eubacterium] siraeum]|nr:hypothetical protein [[Eubacterium] siraeum]
VSKTKLEDTINRLKQEQDKYKKQQKEERTQTANLPDNATENKIKNLENRINNLQARLDKMKSEKDDGKCETCENRRYQDGSDDPGVSFKNASKIDPSAAEAAVRGHEQEHVSHNQAKAKEENKEIVYQSVRIKHGICPECGKTYVAGGETVTVTRTKPEINLEDKFKVGVDNKEKEKGGLLDIAA